MIWVIPKCWASLCYLVSLCYIASKWSLSFGHLTKWSYWMVFANQWSHKTLLLKRAGFTGATIWIQIPTFKFRALNDWGFYPLMILFFWLLGFWETQIIFQSSFLVNLKVRHCFKKSKVIGESLSLAFGSWWQVFLRKITNSTGSVKKFYIA